MTIKSLYFSILFSQAKSYLSINGVFFIYIVSSANYVSDALIIHKALRMWFLSFDFRSNCHSPSKELIRLIFSLVIALFFITHWIISFNTYLFFYYLIVISVWTKFYSTKKLFTNSLRPSTLSFYILTIFSWSLISYSNE